MHAAGQSSAFQEGLCAHRYGFRQVRWWGFPSRDGWYKFTASQAQVVGLLWVAYRTSNQAVAWDDIVRLTGIQSQSMAQLFNGNPAWKAVIDLETRGGRLPDGRIEKARYRFLHPSEINTESTSEVETI